VALTCYQFLHFRFYADSGQLEDTRSEYRVDLDPRVADLLHYLLQHPQQVVTKQQLVDQVWQGSVVTDNSIVWALSQLRKALKDKATSPIFIKTLPKKGYQFLVPVEQVKVPKQKRSSTSKPHITSFYKYRFKLVFMLLITSLISLVYVNVSEPKRLKLTNITNVTTLDGLEEDPKLSPDGQELLFRHKANEAKSAFQLYLTNANDSTQQVTQLTRGLFNYLSGVWGLTNKTMYAVRSHIKEGQYQCEIVEIKRSGEEIELTILQPCHSTSATKLVYHALTNTLFFTDKREDNNYALYSYNLTTQEVKKLTDPTADGLGDNFISLDLNQQQLLILRDSFWSNTEFLSYDIENHRLDSLLFIPARYYKAYFSPNEDSLWINWGNDQLIEYNYRTREQTPVLTNSFGWNYNLEATSFNNAYFSVSDPNYGDILKLENGKLTTQSTQMTELLPAIDGQGERLAFVSNKTGIPQIWVRSIDSGEEYQLSTETQFKEFRNLVWSPSGQWLLAVQQNKIEAYQLEKGIHVLVTEADSGVFYPSFSNDGNTIYFSTVNNDVWQSYSVPFKKETKQIKPLIPEPAWLVRQLKNGLLAYSKPYTSGLFVYDPNNKQSDVLFAELPENDYWQLTDEHIYYRQTQPSKQLMMSPIDTFAPTMVVELPEQTVELFSISASGQIAAFSSVRQQQSDIKKADLTN